MILPEIRDKRLITIHRGEELTDDDHHLLAIWAEECAAGCGTARGARLAAGQVA